MQFVVVPRVENLQEDPLSPFIKRFIGGAHAAARVVAEAKSSKLTTHVCDVRLGVDSWMNARDDGVLLGWQTKTVVAKCVQHVQPRHALVAGKNVGSDVTQWVTYVQAGARWVRKHVEHEEFFAPCNSLWLGKRPRWVGGFERALVFPMVLPFGLHLIGEVGGVAKRRNLGFGVVTRDRWGRALCGHSLRIVDEPEGESTERKRGYTPWVNHSVAPVADRPIVASTVTPALPALAKPCAR